MMVEFAHFSRRAEAATRDTWGANQSSLAPRTAQHLHGAIIFGGGPGALPAPTDIPAEIDAHRHRCQINRSVGAWKSGALAQETSGWIRQAGVPAERMTREPKRYQQELIASARVALTKSKRELIGAHSQIWRLATSILTRLPNAHA